MVVRLRLRQSFYYFAAAVLIVSLLFPIASPTPLYAASTASASTKATETKLVPKYDQTAGLYGYVDAKGKWAIEPKFIKAQPFSEGVAAVAAGFDTITWGYIKPDGSYAIKPKFLQAFEFQKNGLAVVSDKGLAGTIDKNGNYKLKPKYYLDGIDESGKYMATITDVNPNFGGEKHKYGLITSKGALIEPKYDGRPYSKGNFIIVYTEKNANDYNSRKFSMVLASGKVLALDGDIDDVSENIGRITYYSDQVLARSNSTRRYEYITTEGKIYKYYKDESGKQYPFLDACPFSEGLACVAINKTPQGAAYNDVWGYLRKDGTWLVKPSYSGAGSFKNGVAPVRPMLGWGYIKADLSWFIKPASIPPVTKYNKAETTNLSLSLYSQEEYDFTINKAKSIYKSIITSSMSDYQKVDAIYKYVTDTVTYDDNFYSNTIPRVSYSAYGALKYQIAVCEGYSELMSLMLNLAGIENRLVAGVIKVSGIGHAWNLVKLDGRYYHLDATWDAGDMDRRYFLKSDAYMSDTRTWNESSYPKANQDY